MLIFFAVINECLEHQGTPAHIRVLVGQTARAELLPHSLGVRLLEQRGPELSAVGRVHVDEAALVRRQPVVDEHVHPLAEMPKPKPEVTEKKRLQLTDPSPTQATS